MSGVLDIAGLESLDREELRTLWAEVLKAPVPKRMSQLLLRRMLAFELQARRQGGLGKGFLKRLATAAGSAAGAEVATGSKSGAGPRTAARRLAPGARLLRDWNGTTHLVEVTADGFVWQGRPYRSLSVIARTITGAHWSGPRFFGLIAAAPPTDEPAARLKTLRKAGQPNQHQAGRP